MKCIMIVLLAVGTTIGTVSAQTATPRIHHRQLHQQRRIGDGVRSGELTPGEAARLEHREARIRHDTRRAKADGMVTHRERTRLNREQNRANRAIYHQKHDRQVAH